ncbi:MAG TPA: Hsp70 family protein, partial [Phenylobacterium sp.]
MAGLSLGIDFGTTNTVVALAGADGPAELANFPAPEGDLFAFRSALSFFAPADRPRDRTVEAGPWAIEAYVDDPLETRFIQSFKSFAASASFTETQILGRRYVFEDMLSAFLLKLRDHGGAALADLPSRVIVGRPVTFAGAAPDEELALSR